MIYSQETEYALRVIRGLKDGNQKKLASICTEEQIPLSFAYKIGKKLQNAGFVEIRRGRNGGFRLLRDLKTFSLLDVIQVTDKTFSVQNCVGDFCALNAPGHPCQIHLELCRIQQELVRLLEEKTMHEVLLCD